MCVHVDSEHVRASISLWRLLKNFVIKVCGLFLPNGCYISTLNGRTHTHRHTHTVTSAVFVGCNVFQNTVYRILLIFKIGKFISNSKTIVKLIIFH